MKNLLFTILFLSCFNSYSQTNTSEILADGSAITKVTPDVAFFIITVDKKNDSEKNAIRELNTEVQNLQQTLYKLGFTERNIRITSYNISSEENENKKSYNATNILRIEFPLNNQIIDGFYQEIQLANHKDMDITFGTELSTELEKNTRLKLVETAIEDAKRNAENIAKTLNVKIINVKSVSKFNERVFDNRRFDKSSIKTGYAPAVGSPSKSSFDKFQVEDKELEESINIVFEIGKK